ncbi:hypothetical protein GPECTOR_16g689 [Gonium pectorale]|uniref:Uncharacterized protein n=1 Tax=Gonium pectorale TaxID=33097 RepID=A0A150GL44_GONPE|nr:hypothetical protein GPECTOR_16g689 [Gonium pectorale]|eukprot:KXZ50514.1 hypothetical protein GPECTOR_16g689 [Gonium pectorale]
MDRVMVRVSSGKNSFSSRIPQARSYAVSTAQPSSHFSFQTFIYILLALCGVFLVAHFIFTSSESSRLMEKEKEIEKLKWQIEKIRTGVNIKDSSINEQEDAIQRLKTKAQLEHEAKMKAELALSDRAGALQECQEQKTALAGEVAQCHFDLKALLSGETHRVSQQSSAALNSMHRLQQTQQQQQEQDRIQLGQGGGMMARRRL